MENAVSQLKNSHFSVTFLLLVKPPASLSLVSYKCQVSNVMTSSFKFYQYLVFTVTNWYLQDPVLSPHHCGYIMMGI